MKRLCLFISELPTSLRAARLLSATLLSLVLILARRSASAAPPMWQTYTTADGLAGNAVSAVAVAGDGAVWLGTYGEGVSRFDGHRWVSYAKGHGLADDWVTSLAITGDGTVWVGTFDGLSRFDGTRWTTYDRANSGLPGDLVTALSVGMDGVLWVGTYGAGVSRFDNQANGWQTYRRANSGLASDWVTALALDAEGTLWVGTADKGLGRYDGTSWMTYTSAGSGLADGEVRSIAASAGGQVWVGTTEGASAFDGRTWTGYRFPDGQDYRRVNAVAIEANGHLWLGTNRGLLYYDGAAWTSLGTDDGLAHEYVAAIAGGRSDLWFGTMAGVTRRGEAAPRLPQPLPVVLVHGWHGPSSDRVEDSQLRYLARWLEQDGHRVFYATGITAERNLYQNARRLGQFIAQVRSETGAEAVNVVAHSMGGLVVRTYVESALYQGDVAQVVMLGTPQAGLRLWYGFLARELRAGSDEPSLRELTPEFMGLFNRLHQNDRQVPYLLIAGDARQHISALQDLPASDGLISVGSAQALEGASVSHVVTEDVHGWGPATILFGVASYLWPANTYRAHLRNLLRDRPLSSHQRPSFLPPKGETHTPYYQGSIVPGQRIEHEVAITPSRGARFLLTWDRGDLEFELLAPSGQRIDPSEAAKSKDLDYLALAGDEAFPFALYRVTDPQPGTWRMVIRGPDDSSATASTPLRASPGTSLTGPVGYTAYAVLDDGLSLEVSTDTAAYRQGQDVTITARLSELPNPPDFGSLTVRAELAGPGGVIATVPLLDDGVHGDGMAGDGIYANRFQAPRTGGYFPLFVSAAGSWRGVAFERAQEAIIMVSSETASLTGRYADHAEDLDGDGTCDQVVIEVGVRVVRAGEFALAVVLADHQGRPVTRTVLPLILPAGEHTVSVPLDGDLMRRDGTDGPVVVQQVTLLDLSGAALLLDEARDAHRALTSRQRVQVCLGLTHQATCDA